MESHEGFVAGLSNYSPDHLSQAEIACHAGFFSAAQKRYLAHKERIANQLLTRILLECPSRIGDCLEDSFSRSSYQRVQDLRRLLDLSDCRRFVMVGCGAFPATMFWLSDHFPDIDCIGLDIDAETVALAAGLASRLGRSQLRFLSIDGCDFDFSGADFVFVANHVMPKRAVLEQLLRSGKQGVQVVVREPTRLGELLAESVRPDMPAGFSIAESGEDSRTFLSYDLVLSCCNV